MSENKSKGVKYTAYIIALLILSGGIYLFLTKYNSIIPSLRAAVSGPEAPPAKVMNASGPLAGLPQPKQYTSKGVWCNCPAGYRCSGTWDNCNCCNDAVLKKRLVMRSS